MGKIIFDKMEKMDYYTRESYKSLRTNLQFCGTDIKTILFTSCTQNEGKSSVAFDTAVSLADDDKKVIFVDVDLRKSILIGRYKATGLNFGISHYLSGQCKLEDVLYETNIQNLDVSLCSKYPPNPAELLGHDNFKNMILKLRKEYDYVIIDTPPLGLVIDSAIVAQCCDGAVIVVEANKTNRNFVQEVKKQIERSGCTVLGAVLNKVPMTKGSYYGKYGRYGKYYGGYGEHVVKS